MTSRVSVILPTFNRAHSLGAAMSSVLSQSVRNLDLIVVDDASSDDTEAIVRAMWDSRVRYIRRPQNGGAAAARNTGIAAAEGDYIAFQDSDDLWLPDKLAAQLGLFSELPADVGVVTGPKILYTRGRVSITPSPDRRLSLEGDQLGSLLDENRLSVQCALFRRDRLPAGDWFDPCARANEDWEFAVRLAQQTRIYEDSEPVVLGFVSSDSISTNLRRQTIGEMRILKHNRTVLRSYKRQRASMLRDVARVLHRTGKQRWARRFMRESIAGDPRIVLSFMRAMLRSASLAARRSQVRA